MLHRIGKQDGDEWFPEREPERAPVTAKLKILWIEDEQPDNLMNAKDLLQCFSIFRVETPGEIRDALHKFRDVVALDRSMSTSYQLGVFPFDAYVCDFRLSGASGEPDVEGANIDRELRLLKNSALEAEAGGLTSGVMTALNFPDHPAVVLPYTGYPVPGQYSLLCLLLPPTIRMADKVGRGFKKQEASKVFEKISSSYRTSMIEWSDEGRIQIPYKEKQRLMDLAATRALNESDKLNWLPEDVINVITPYHQRAIALSSLWFKVQSPNCSIGEFQGWLEQFPAPRQDYIEAARLAEQYFYASITPESVARHQISKSLQELASPAGEKMDSNERHKIYEQIRQTCHRIDLVPEDVLGHHDEVSLRDDKKHPRLPHLCKVETHGSLTVRRLAALMLLVREVYLRDALMQQEWEEQLEPHQALLKEWSDSIDKGQFPGRLKIPIARVLEKWENPPEAAIETLSVLFNLGVEYLTWEEGELWFPSLPRGA